VGSWFGRLRRKESGGTAPSPGPEFDDDEDESESEPISVEALTKLHFQAIQETGILPTGMDFRQFVALVESRGALESIEEAADEWNEWGEYDMQTARNVLLVDLFGFRYDHRFPTGEVLLLAQRALSRNGVPELKWSDEADGEAPTWRRQVRLKMAETQLHWGFQSLPGLVRGLNELLSQRGSQVLFLSLETGWDAYAFVCADTTVLDRIANSDQFLVSTEADDKAGALS